MASKKKTLADKYKQKPCFYLYDLCPYQDRCSYLHFDEVAVISDCLSYKLYGICYYGASCVFSHIRYIGIKVSAVFVECERRNIMN